MSTNTLKVLPPLEDLQIARSKIVDALPLAGLGYDATTAHLSNDIVPGLNRASKSPNYYGFVTGGATPASTYADHLVTEHDQSLSVHLPNETITTNVEDAALRMICELIGLDKDASGASEWQHRTFTTGATASNIVGLACAREYVIQTAARKLGRKASTAEDGLFKAMQIAEIDEIQILSSAPHSSLKKSASVVGIGRDSIKDVGQNSAPHKIDLDKLISAASQPRTASIVAVSCAEINTGLFATDAATMRTIRSACDWIHIDAAFGLMACTLPDEGEYQILRSGVACLELADSIAGDAHKLFNVPYDCGIFFSKHLLTATEVFQNVNAVYLNTASSEITASKDRSIPSPLNIGIENSRRFRALPVYANLVSLGRDGYRDMIIRQITLARKIAQFVFQSPDYELLPASQPGVTLEERLSEIYMIVIFRAYDRTLNEGLTRRINNTRKVYVSGTQWESKAATRFAVANWQVDVDRDLKLVQEVLGEVLSE